MSKIIEHKTKPVDVVVDVVCNRCKKSCRASFAPPHEFQFEYAYLAAQWGYGTTKDGELHKADLCEECYDLLVKDFGLNPDVKDSLTFE